jgi:phosphocarrier protein
MKSTTTVSITNRLGLHARPAMMFVDVASKFTAEVTVRRCDQVEFVDGKSIMQLMMLAATQGTELEICAKGEDAEDATEELQMLIRSNFSEE